MLRMNNQYAGLRWLSGPYAICASAQNSLGHGWAMSNRAFSANISYPQGYNDQRAIKMPFVSIGQIAAILRGDSTFTNTEVRGIGNLNATLAASSDVTANANMGANIYASLAGEASLTLGLTAKGWMSAVVNCGAQPTAFDIAQEVWNSQTTAYTGTGTFGKFIQTLLSVAKFLGLK